MGASAHLQIRAPNSGACLEPLPLAFPFPPHHSCAAAPPPHPRDPAMSLPAPPTPAGWSRRPGSQEAQAQRGPSGLTGRASRRQGGAARVQPACWTATWVDTEPAAAAPREAARSGMPGVQAAGAAAQTPLTTRGPRGLRRVTVTAWRVTREGHGEAASAARRTPAFTEAPFPHTA